MSPDLKPKLFTILQDGYSRKQFAADLTAGTIVGIVALPLAIAFAIASGVKPEQGLFTAIIAGFIVSAFGGSRVQIAGPTGAFIVIVYGIVQRYGYDGLLMATMIAGILLIIMGVFRFGALLRFVPYPLTVGFTSGIALIILTSQINDFLGLGIADLPAGFFDKWSVYALAAPSTDVYAAGVGLLSLAVILLVQKYAPRLPGSLFAIIASTALVHAFQMPVETIGSRFGEVPNMLPTPSFPEVSWNTVTRVFTPAVTIAMLGAIESLLSAVVADGMIRSRHRSNVELVAQGIANVVSPLFGGIPATGAIARTATNVKAGGRTPISGIVHSVVLLLIMLFFGRWAGLIPMPALAAILLVVAYNMSEWRSFRKILNAPRGDVAVMLITFGLTVVVDLTAAIQVGVILSAMLFIKRMAEVSQVTPLSKSIREPDEKEGELIQRTIPDGVEVFEASGSLFFGAVEQFTETLQMLKTKPKVFVLETEHLLAVDATGLRAVDELLTDLKSHGTRFMLAGIHKQPMFAMTQAGLLDRIGEENIFGDLDQALDAAEQHLANVKAALDLFHAEKK